MLISIITDEKNKMVKVFDKDLKVSSPSHLFKGEIVTKDLSAEELADLVPNLPQTSCLCLGVNKDFPGPDIPTVIKVNPNREKGEIARAKQDLVWPLGLESWAFFDFDNAGVTPAEGMAILKGIDSRLQDCPTVTIPSSSSHIWDGDKELRGATNFHIYFAIQVEDEEYFEDFFKRLLLAGHCKAAVTRAGSIVMRSIVDKAVFSSEREIFELNSEFESPTMYSKRTEHITFDEAKGEPIFADRRLQLTDEEDLQLRILMDEKREAVSGEATTQRKIFRTVRAERKAKLNGTAVEDELEQLSLKNSDTYDQSGRPVYELQSSEAIYDNDSQLMLVADILMKPTAWDTKKIPDPHEPFLRGDEEKGDVGRGVATVLQRDDGSVFIFSHANAGQIYHLRWNAEHLAKIVANPTVTVDDKKRIWKRLTSGSQEFSVLTTDSDVSDVADIFKTMLAAIPDSGVATEKKKVEIKLKQAAKAKPIDEEEKPLMLRFNSVYGMTLMGGKASVVHEEYNPNTNTFEAKGLKPYDLATYYANERVLHKDLRGSVFETCSYKIWEQAQDRNTFTSTCFKPNATRIRKPGQVDIIKQGGTYNMWQGYIADMSKATSCELIKRHLFEVWCGSDDRYYKYLIAWLAALFQYPEYKCGTSLILKSAQGAGKNIIIDNILVSILGVHALSTASKDDFVGKFNNHMAWNVFTFANEAFWAGDKGDKSLLKTLTTDGERTIEPKGFDKIKAKSYTKLIFASNDMWVMNLDIDDRRSVYLPVSDRRNGNTDYFDKLMNEIENGGKESFLDFLLNVIEPKLVLAKEKPTDLSEGKVADILQSAPPEVKFVNSLVDEEGEFELYETLEEFSIVIEDLKKWKESGDEELVLRKGDFHSMFSHFCKQCQISRKHITMQTMAGTLKHWGICRKAIEVSDGVVDKDKVLLLDTRRRMGKGSSQLSVYRLKPWNDCKDWVQVAYDLKVNG